MKRVNSSLPQVVFILSFLLMANLGMAQPVYTVNTTSLGVGTPTDTYGSIDVMIENALAYANLGNEAIVNLSTTDLVDLNVPLPTISVTHSSGKIIIQKGGGGLIPDQGIRYVGGPSMPGFSISSCLGDVEIKNLRIESYLTGIRVEPRISGVSGDIKIEGNYLYNNYDKGIYIVATSGVGNFGKIDITNNTIEGQPYFYLTPTHFGLFCDFGESETHHNDKASLELSIVGNTIYHFTWGIALKNSEFFTEALMTVNIDNNNISLCRDGVLLLNPKKDLWTFTNNSISNIYYSGLIMSTNNFTGSGYPAPDSPFPGNFNIVESGNVMGMTSENSGNSFVECRYHAIVMNNMDEVHLVNLSVDGEIRGGYGKPYYVRECLMNKPTDFYSNPLIPFNSIHWNSGDDVNEGIPAPNPISAELDGTDLTIHYSTYGLFEVNEPFKVEFFEADEDRSLVTFLGSQDVSSAAPNAYSKLISGFSFTSGTQLGMTITSIDGALPGIGTSEVVYIGIDQEPCDTCNSLRPISGEKYWLSAWVQEEHLEQVKAYEMANISLNFFAGDIGTTIQFFPTGEIIDGWQRIVGEFTMPMDSEQFIVQLNAHPSLDTYFDDIRIHPFNGSMKSYVYDGETFWLTSELDDNNYATFYEYDEEGGLVRIKKETARGIVTIQETRSNTLKKDDDETE